MISHRFVLLVSVVAAIAAQPHSSLSLARAPRPVWVPGVRQAVSDGGQPASPSSTPISPRSPRFDRLMGAYAFVVGQRMSLDRIGTRFPDLAKAATVAGLGFVSSALGSGYRNAVEELKRLTGANWKQLDSELQASLRAGLSAQRFDRTQATAFIAEVEARAKGSLQESVRTTLLASNPSYIARPELEFVEGWRQSYRTKGHPKAKGVDCSVSFPASWTKREGERPNIIQVFESSSDAGRALCNVMIKRLPVPEGETLTEEDAREILSPENLKELVPEGGRLVETKKMTLDGSPSGFVVCDLRLQRLDQEVLMRMASFVTIQGNAMIFIQCGVGAEPGNESALDAAYKLYLPVFRSIAGSLVLNDKYP
jgi:hypothetical protein